VKLNNFKVQ